MNRSIGSIFPVIFLVFHFAKTEIAYAEPHILLGPSEPDEEPEAVETISGLSYDQLKKLRELRKWLDDRQKIRDERDLKAALTQPQSLSLFKDREILTPLGQRAPSLKIKSPSQEGEDLKLPPLPRFDESKEDIEIDEALQGGPLPDLVKSKHPSKVTHITPPPLGDHQEGVQVEYELSPERNLGIED